MTPEHREPLHAPSEWDVLLSPELGPLFVLEAAIVAAHRFLSVQLDPSSSLPGRANHWPTRALLNAMRILRKRIRSYRFVDQAFAANTQPTLLDCDDDRALPQASAANWDPPF